MTDPSTIPKPWPPLARVGFRFLLVYFVLYALAPYLAFLSPAYEHNGSGDTTFHYMQLVAIVGVAGSSCLIWSLLDRKRESYPRLAEWLLVGARYYLALMLCSYGFAKVFLLQFAEPRLATLLQRFGDASPMGLAWRFVGFSPAYEFFAGALELLAGMLLLSRRTTSLGALLGAAVLSNVVMMNYCFDIPVKLFSTHLLALALGIAALDGRRVLDVLLFNRPTQPVEYPPHFRRPKLHVAGRVLKGLLIAALVLPNLYSGVQAYRSYGPGAPRSPLYGIYEVVEMRDDGELRPGLITDASRWRHVVFDHPRLLAVQKMDDSLEYYGLVLDREAGTMTLSPMQDGVPGEPFADEWTIRELGDGVLLLAGALDGHQLELRVEAIELDGFLLTTRGFHWINEIPLNR